MISIDGLAVQFGGTTLFKDINFVVNEKDRIALMGKNGAGKSTFLKIKFSRIFLKISCYPPKKNKIFCICIGEAPR